MARFAELSESELSTILEEKDAENTKKATKVTLNIFRGFLLQVFFLLTLLTSVSPNVILGSIWMSFKRCLEPINIYSAFLYLKLICWQATTDEPFPGPHLIDFEQLRQINRELLNLYHRQTDLRSRKIDNQEGHLHKYERAVDLS